MTSNIRPSINDNIGYRFLHISRTGFRFGIAKKPFLVGRAIEIRKALAEEPGLSLFRFSAHPFREGSWRRM